MQFYVYLQSFHQVLSPKPNLETACIVVINKVYANHLQV